MRSICFRWTLLAVAVLLVQGGRLTAEDWPQFRGPNCTGISLSKKTLPLEFSATKNVSWTNVLGEGIGSPAVVAGRVFSTGMTTAKSGEQSLVAFAFDAVSGKKLWQHEIPAGAKPLPFINPTNSH